MSISDLKQRKAHLGEREYEVIGVLIGARGVIDSSMIDLFELFELPKTRLPEMAEKVIAASVRIISQYSSVSA